MMPCSCALGQEVSQLPAAGRQAHLEELVLRVVREVTGDAVTASTPLMEAGVDSLGATELASRLRSATELDVSATVMFDYPTPRDIAAHMLEQLRVCVPASLPASSSPGGAEMTGLSMGNQFGRWPGGCSSAGALAGMLVGCGDALGAVPAQRWTLELMVEMATLSEVQAACVQHGGFIGGAERFDSRFFGVSRAEAGAMDPQQRLLLEVGYESLHGGGERRSSLLGGDGGVFVGIERPDWHSVMSMLPELQSSVYAATGGTVSVASGRLSFVLGMQGPCLSVDLSLIHI